VPKVESHRGQYRWGGEAGHDTSTKVGREVAGSFQKNEQHILILFGVSKGRDCERSQPKS